MIRALFRAMIASAILGGCTTPSPAATPIQAASCAIGYYSLGRTDGVDIGYSGEDTLRWRRADGTSGLMTPDAGSAWVSSRGWTGQPDDVAVDTTDCAEGHIIFDGIRGQTVPLMSTETAFTSDGTRLAGRLVLPEGSAAVPIIVLVHGSEDSSALRDYALQRILPARGVGVFVFDKRGTGDSEGIYTHDIPQLARDAAAAYGEARRLSGHRLSRIGYYGMSQGGWTAPRAATLSGADFVIVGYGLAVSPMEEDQEAVAVNMRDGGFGPMETEKAMEIARAAEAIILQGFQSGYSELVAKLDQYAGEPWLPYVRGNITHVIISTPEEYLRQEGPRLLNGVIPDYDSLQVLQSLDVPQLWMLGGRDIEAPPGETIRRLIDLKAAGHPIAIAVFPNADHGLYEFETVDGERLSTRQPASVVPMLVEFAKHGRLDGTYSGVDILS